MHKRKRKRSSSGGFEAFFEFLGSVLNALVWWAR